VLVLVLIVMIMILLLFVIVAVLSFMVVVLENGLHRLGRRAPTCAAPTMDPTPIDRAQCILQVRDIEGLGALDEGHSTS
jgi:hypothetical protein